jgi:hypothetical protein
MLISNDITKQKYLIDSLTKDINKGKIFSLYLVSCYFTLISASYLIYELQKLSVTLSDVWIFIDRKQSISIGKQELIKWQNEWQTITEPYQLKINFRIIDSDELFHVKAYYLVENESQALTPYSRLVIGSANLTKNGITSNYGNIELLSYIPDSNLHKEFYKQLEAISNHFTIQLSEVDDFSKDNIRNLYYSKFSLIANGYLIKHLDKNTKTSLLDVTYKFNENYRNPDDRGEGNLKDTREYFNKQEIEKIFRKYNKFYHVHWRDYAIKTVFGHWIPKYLVEYLNEWDNSDYRKEYRKEIDNFWKDNESKIQKKICDNILEFVSNKWLREEWFFQTIGSRKYKSILTTYEIENIGDSCYENENLKNKISKIVTNSIMIKMKQKINKNEKNLVLKYSVSEVTDFVDIDYTKIINTLYKDLCNSTNSKKNIPNKNQKIPDIINLNMGNLELIEESLKPNDFLES